MSAYSWVSSGSTMLFPWAILLQPSQAELSNQYSTHVCGVIYTCMVTGHNQLSFQMAPLQATLHSSSATLEQAHQ